jgi:hypothetical protein
MARLNITIPDPLYERLKRLEDRVNASKVCAIAIEKELNVIETRPEATDPDIQQVIARFQSSSEKWRQRGYQDGREWAIKKASREELQGVASVQTGLGRFPNSFDSSQALDAWLYRDVGLQPGEMIGRQSGSGRTLTDQDLERERGINDGRREMDQAAYTSGWKRAADEVWKAVAPALR